MKQDLKISDEQIYRFVQQEAKRQTEGVELIASENYVSKAVLQATGSVLTNKYSEGYPGKRYYSGNAHVDSVENIAIERAKKLFSAEHANVQPHSGSQANAEAYFSVLKPGDKILAMDLAHGGHLTHGSVVNFSGKTYNFVSYGVSQDTKTLDMDEIRRLALQEQPKLIVSGFTAYPRIINFREFNEIANEVGAYHMSDIAHIAGLVAAGVHPSPIPCADIVTTTTHKTLRGPRGAMILSKLSDRLNPKDKKNLAQKVDSAVFPGMQGGPFEHVIAAKAVSFGEAMKTDFIVYQRQVLLNAKALAESLLDNGLDLVSGGTDNHLMIIDLTNTRLSGKEADAALESVNIFANKNMIPFDPRTPFNPSGIRLGTPALTTRGMKESELKFVGECIAKIIHNVNNKTLKDKVRSDIMELCGRFPMYSFGASD